MNGIVNNEKITMIQMFPNAHCLCAIGKDWYTINFNVFFFPLQSYPDYMLVADWIAKNIDGKELNIEEAVDRLWNYLQMYSPGKCRVVANVNDATTHFPVKVIKE